ncbi:ABC transporter [Pilimelia anulata]|uniref:ABC transporter n=1 Tax=Pilimelia anulata TaxID=53371 RepID=A0A8J3BA17_9ACTN|nr:ABC transporter permease [Pilimelia anulata]GGJ91106.1 ABC transporter [Pilimelia anulata]
MTAATTAPAATTTRAATTAAAGARRAPRLGGFSPTLIGLEIRRVLRNRRNAIFTMIMPAVFFLIFGTSREFRTQSIGDGGNVTGYVLVSMAVYAALLATTAAGAAVSIERAAGWSRQLRLTPLRPGAYIAVKVIVGMLSGAVAVAAVSVVGAFAGARLSPGDWVACLLLAWGCALVFAAFGLFMGYLLPSENVMQVLGPVLAVLSFAGGLFIPPEQLGTVLADIAPYFPTYGVAHLARYPLTQDGSLAGAILNVALWTLVFTAGAIWRFRRDTARV